LLVRKAIEFHMERAHRPVVQSERSSGLPSRVACVHGHSARHQCDQDPDCGRDGLQCVGEAGSSRHSGPNDRRVDEGDAEDDD
jgi:hypothetical protein